MWATYLSLFLHFLWYHYLLKIYTSSLNVTTFRSRNKGLSDLTFPPSFYFPRPKKAELFVLHARPRGPGQPLPFFFATKVHCFSSAWFSDWNKYPTNAEIVFKLLERLLVWVLVVLNTNLDECRGGDWRRRRALWGVRGSSIAHKWRTDDGACPQRKRRGSLTKTLAKI